MDHLESHRERYVKLLRFAQENRKDFPMFPFEDIEEELQRLKPSVFYAEPEGGKDTTPEIDVIHGIALTTHAMCQKTSLQDFLISDFLPMHKDWQVQDLREQGLHIEDASASCLEINRSTLIQAVTAIGLLELIPIVREMPSYIFYKAASSCLFNTPNVLNYLFPWDDFEMPTWGRVRGSELIRRKALFSSWDDIQNRIMEHCISESGRMSLERF